MHTMQMHEKKRLEIFIEAPALRRLTALLDAIDMSGYTIIPVLGGSGEHGAWTRDGLVSSAGGMVSVVCIVDEDELDAVVERVYTLVSRQIGVVNVTDCTVIRDAKF
tara:strand:+ start:1560 stop:1880 length:321 start_codon:yes stop_codon:yes gene_type:complete